MPRSCLKFAEYYSPPRVARLLTHLLMLFLSTDLLTQWDFENSDVRALSLHLLGHFDVGFCMLSPPCQAFSELQRLWNFKRMPADKVADLWAQGMLFLDHSMQCCHVQHSRDRYFCFEHPQKASSWKQSTVEEVRKLPGVMTITFDQCMVGLKSPITKTPMRKRTRLMTNSKALVQCFSGLMCDKSHNHCQIKGSEGGVKLSRYAQVYPAEMCERIARAVEIQVG